MKQNKHLNSIHVHLRLLQAALSVRKKNVLLITTLFFTLAFCQISWITYDQYSYSWNISVRTALPKDPFDICLSRLSKRAFDHSRPAFSECPNVLPYMNYFDLEDYHNTTNPRWYPEFHTTPHPTHQRAMDSNKRTRKDSWVLSPLNLFLLFRFETNFSNSKLPVLLSTIACSSVHLKRNKNHNGCSAWFVKQKVRTPITIYLLYD